MKKAITPIVIALVPALIIVACGGDEQEPQTAVDQTYPQGTYAQPAATYAQPTTTYTQPTATTTATTTATASPMGGMAFPCQSDATCVTHRCNMTTGRCAWPCQTNDDCQAGNQCVSPMCVPAGFTPAQ